VKNYVVTYSPFGNPLSADYQEIQGVTAIDAARKFVSGKYSSVRRSGDRDVNLCLVEGKFDKVVNRLLIRGRHQWYRCE